MGQKRTAKPVKRLQRFLLGRGRTWGGAGIKDAEVVSSKLSQKSLRAVCTELGEGGGVCSGMGGGGQGCLRDGESMGEGKESLWERVRMTSPEA